MRRACTGKVSMSTGATCAPHNLCACLHGKGGGGEGRTQDSSPSRTGVDLLRWNVPGGVRILDSRSLGEPGRLSDAC